MSTIKEELLASARAVVCAYDTELESWQSTDPNVRAVWLYKNPVTNLSRIVCLGDDRAVLLNVGIHAGFQLTKVSDQFARFEAAGRPVGLNFAQIADAASFITAINTVIADSAAGLASAALPPPLLPAERSSGHQRIPSSNHLGDSLSTSAGPEDENSVRRNPSTDLTGSGGPAANDRVYLRVQFVKKGAADGESMTKVMAFSKSTTLAKVAVEIAEKLGSFELSDAGAMGYDLWSADSMAWFSLMENGSDTLGTFMLPPQANVVFCHRPTSRFKEKKGASTSKRKSRIFHRSSRQKLTGILQDDDEEDLSSSSGSASTQAARKRNPARSATSSLRNTSSGTVRQAAALSPDREMDPSRKAKVKTKLTSFFASRLSQQDLLAKGVLTQELYQEPAPLSSALCKRLFARIQALGLEEEGMYRVSAQHDEIRTLCAGFHDSEVALDGVKDVHVLAGAVKLYFRELTPPLIEPDHYHAFMASEYDVGSLRTCVRNLPAENRSVLSFLIEHLDSVAARQSENKMSPHNLGVCFGPALFHTPGIVDPVSATTLADTKRTIVETLIEHRVEIFA